MTHFGIICPPATGHLNPMIALGNELHRRGHRVTAIGLLDIKAIVLAAGLEFFPILESEFPPGSTTEYFRKLGKFNGLAGLRCTIELLQELSVSFLHRAPQAIKTAGIELLLIDEALSAGITIAEHLNIPFVTVCSDLILKGEDVVPPYFTTWDYNLAWWALIRNQVGYAFLHNLLKPIHKTIADYRCEWNLAPYSHNYSSELRLATLSQQPPEFEFPRRQLPSNFYFTGPLHHPRTRQDVDFPFEKLSGKRLIYASLGTVQNQIQYIFSYIAEACAAPDVQLVISLGGSLEPEELPKLPGNPVVVKYAPQLELLQKASLTITHGGMNTTLESLSNGVPLVVIPITNSQPGVATRIAWSGAGEFIPLNKLTVANLRNTVQRVMTEDFYRQNAERLQEDIQYAGGLEAAANIIVGTTASIKKLVSA
ncbi:MAG: glycosyltransferase [Mastigocoleus sp. MO_167.B18]|nr:glycosyltransferase [Mastigocoleus sp. MO_167.B18]